MTIPRRFHCRIWLVGCLSVALPSPSSVSAQNESAGDDEIQVVFRFSKQFLSDAADREIVAKLPFCATLVGFRCTATIQGKGTPKIVLPESDRAAVFSIEADGTGSACVRGVHGPIVALAPARGTWNSRSTIHFDGRRFEYAGTDVSVNASALS